MKQALSKSQSVVFGIVLLTFYSCASYKTRYSKDTNGWQEVKPSSGLVLTHTMYLIGDAGNDSPEIPDPVLKYLKVKLEQETENSSILFLGDNIYPSGMPPKEDSLKRISAEYRMDSQLEILSKFKGRPIFIPGNHDWRTWGKEGLKRQERYVQKHIRKQRDQPEKEDEQDYFLPLDGCSGPEVVELNDNVVVIVVDSQWWLADWNKQPKMNDGCEIKNREHFLFVFENVVRKYRNKQLVIAMHHPVYTYGPHGGRFTPKQHLFPLTEFKPNLFVPLPVIGSIATTFRATVGSRQDVANGSYKKMKKGLLAAANKNGQFIFASGHEHTLQYIEDNNHKYIVSGSGSKRSPVGMGSGSLFATPEMGFSTIDFYSNGEAWVTYYEVNKEGTGDKVVFRRKIREKSGKVAELEKIDFLEYELHKDSINQFVTKKKAAQIDAVHGVLLGRHYRKLYQIEYPFKVLDLASEHGGLSAVKLGGGNQTNSLRLASQSGREYVLRGLAKDATRFIPFPFNKMTAAKFVVEDNFLSTNPFAPLSMPFLADAVKVYHTNPQLVYVPAQPALESYNLLVGGTMNLYEERPKGKGWRKNAPFFGNPDKIIGTDDVVEAVLEDPDQRVDEPWMLRTRLFDFLIGDWDRHDDQWAWAQINQKGDRKIFRPIPKDRDQAFSLYDGTAAGVARYTQPFLRQLQSFNPEVKNVKWSTWSARLVDRTFLNSLSWQDWQLQVRYIQENLTDDVIENSFQNWPSKAKSLAAGNISLSIKTRRDNLMNIARKHYELISSSVNVIGTEKKERFEIICLNDKQVEVNAWHIGKKDKLKERFFSRVFETDITKEINIYGNGDDDEFVLTGSTSPNIKIRWIGGLGKDRFWDSTSTAQEGKKVYVYDNLKNKAPQKSKLLKDARTDIYRFNVYDRRNNDSNYNIALPMPIVGYNPDDGLILGGSVNFVRFGFKKEPYASLQKLDVKFSFGTKALSVFYTGDFLNAFKTWDLYLDTKLHGPSYAFNYAGIGNNSFRERDRTNFYRVRQKGFLVYPAIKKRFANNEGFVAIGPFAEYSDVEATPGRFIASQQNGLEGTVDADKFFAGARVVFDFKNVDNYIIPHAGVKLNTQLSYVNQLNSSKQFTSLRATFSFYKAIDAQEKLILASQFGTGINFGAGYEFFQMPTLGIRQGLRGYRAERFYGKSNYWHNTDLRYKINSNYNPTLPLTYGVFGSFDYGRVWVDNDLSKNWHFNYGGGIWFAPVDIMTFAVGAFVPKEKKEEKPLIAVQLGFWF